MSFTGGGKFVNGAITGAFSMLFNDLMEHDPPEEGTENSGNGMSAVDWVQGGLDVAGLIPGIGEIADGINALIYVVNGDYVNAGLSAAAMIPVAGWAATGGKVVNKAVKVTQHSDELVKAAQKLYPNKAGKIELHHITPKYLGGAKNGPMVPLDGAYHQMITNEFRKYWGYGQGTIKDPVLRQQIMNNVYSKYPLSGH